MARQASGPYGYSPAAAPFDRAVGRWARAPRENADALLGEAASLADKALSCGFPSLVMLHGALRRDFSRFTPRLLANAAPTYYGMAVATY